MAYLGYFGFILICALRCHGQQLQYDCRRWNTTCANQGTCRMSTNLCQCKLEYEGYNCGLQTATKREASFCNKNICQNGGTCYSNGGQPACYCSPSYYGDTCSKPRVSVECLSSEMLISVKPFDGFDGIIYVRDHRDNDSCVLQRKPHGTYELTLQYLKNCGAGVPGKTIVFNKPNLGETYYQTDLVVLYNPSTMTKLDELHNIRCVENRNMDLKLVSIGSNIAEESNMTKTKTEETYVPITFEIMDVNGKPHQKPVYVGDFVTLQLELKDKTVFNDFIVEECRAIDLSTSSETNSISIIKQNCLNTNAYSVIAGDLIKDISSAVKISLKIRAFKFVDSPSVGFRCKTRGCKLHDNSCNQVACPAGGLVGFGTEPPKVKRDVSGAEKSRQKVPDEQILSKTLYVREHVSLEEENQSANTCMRTKEFVTLAICMAAVSFVLLVLCIVLMTVVVRKRQSSKQPGEDTSPPLPREMTRGRYPNP